MTTTREEHMTWCKERALEYVTAGDYPQAIASMLSDLGKHDETISAGQSMAPLAMFELMNPTEHGIRSFIKGFR